MLRVNERGVFIDARNKIVWFDLNGRLLKEFRKPNGHFVVEPFQNSWVTLFREATGQGIDLTVTRCASDFSVPAMYTACASKRSGFSLFPDQLNFVSAGSSFYIENSLKGFFVSQYSGDGNLVRTLQLNVSPVGVSLEDPAPLSFPRMELRSHNPSAGSDHPSSSGMVGPWPTTILPSK